jgi:alanyl-tRNA synthetase
MFLRFTDNNPNIIEPELEENPDKEYNNITEFLSSHEEKQEQTMEGLHDKKEESKKKSFKLKKKRKKEKMQDQAKNELENMKITVPEVEDDKMNFLSTISFYSILT